MLLCFTILQFITVDKPEGFTSKLINMIDIVLEGFEFN